MSVIEPILPGQPGGIGGGPIVVVPGPFPGGGGSSAEGVNDFLIGLLELQLDSGTGRHAETGVSVVSQSFRFDKRLISCSTISREIPLIQGLYSVGALTVELDNSDQYLNILKSSTSWRNRPAIYRYGWSGQGYSAMSIMFTGVLEDWSFSGDRCQITLRDKFEDKFDQPMSKFFRRLTPGGYPDDVPAFSKPYLIPAIFGSWPSPDVASPPEHEGWFPAYCINAVTFTYVLGLSVIVLDDIFVYGVWVDSADYTVSTITSGGTVFATVTFDTDPLDPNRSIDEIAVTWTGRSLDVIGEEHANLVTVLRSFLPLAGIDVSEIDTGRLDTIASEHDALGIVGGIGITKSEETFGEVLNKWSMSAAAPIFRTKAGLLSAVFLGTTASPTKIFTGKDVHEGTFSYKNNPFENLAATLQYNYDWNYAREFFHKQPDYVIPGSEAELGEDIRDNISQWYGQSDDDGGNVGALAVATLQGELMREGVLVVEFEVDPVHALDLELGDIVELTHWELSDGAAQEVHITGLHLNPSAHSASLRIVGYVLSQI